MDNSGSWPPRGSITVNGGSNITIQNCYIHGWSILNPVSGSDCRSDRRNRFLQRIDGRRRAELRSRWKSGKQFRHRHLRRHLDSGERDRECPQRNGTHRSCSECQRKPGIRCSLFRRSVGKQQRDIARTRAGPSITTSFMTWRRALPPYTLEAGASELGNTQYVYNNLVWNVGDIAPIVIASDLLGSELPVESIYLQQYSLRWHHSGMHKRESEFLCAHESYGSKQSLYFRTAGLSGVVLEPGGRKFRLRLGDQCDLREQRVDDGRRRRRLRDTP